MTTLDLNILESALDTRGRQLARSLAARDQIAIERSADVFDATLLAAERETSAHALEHDFELLREIEAARGRIREGTFGVCLGCEESIAVKRLRAIPWAAYCVSCQAGREEVGAQRPILARAA